jgi:CMP-N-acetylneuraminic acid synthetase
VVEGVIIPEERAIDIDSALDFHIAEILMSEKTCQEITSG